MNMQLRIPYPQREIVYPESDGEPMADNTRQLDWITLLYSNLRILFHERADEVFVGANQLWYPVEGEPDIRRAPDVYVVFGRPQHHRGSYMQWVEAGVPITVAIEILSSSNDHRNQTDTQFFYEEHGVQEYLLYDPESGLFKPHGRLPLSEMLHSLWPRPKHYVSKFLGVTFDNTGDELVATFPNGRRFLTLVELEAERLRTADEAERQRLLAAHALNLAVWESQRADAAEEEATRQRQRADQQAEMLARLMFLSRRLARGQATPEELAELQQLHDASL